MKKLFAITFALLILLSGMHISLATHFCGGEVAAVKWSLAGKAATCGMELPVNTCPTHTSLDSNCCQNEISVYTVDSNYNLSPSQSKGVTQHLLQVFFVAVSFSASTFVATTPVNVGTSPPGNLFASTVNLADICIFRI